MAVTGFWGAETGNLIETVSTIGTPSVVTSNARTGTYSFDTTNGDSINFDDRSGTDHYGVIGFAIRRANDFSGRIATGYQADSGPSNLYVDVENDNTVTVGVGTDKINSTTGLTVGTWYYIEVVLSASGTELFIDGSSEGTDTTVPQQITGVRLQGGPLGSALFDDIYISDDTTPLGDCEVFDYASLVNSVTPDTSFYGTASDLDSGTWIGMESKPFTTTDKGYEASGAQDGVVICDEGGSGGVANDTNLSGSIKALKAFGALRRSGGSGTSQHMNVGKYSSSTYTASISPDLDITTSTAYYEFCNGTTAQMPALTDHIAKGLYKSSGGQDFIAEAFYAFILHVPAAGSAELAADTQSYTVTGVAADLDYTRVMDATTQTYSVSGVANNLIYAKQMTAETQSYTVNGVANDFDVTRHLEAVAQSYSISGVAADLDLTELWPANTTTYSVGGVANAFEVARHIEAETQSYSVSGVANDFSREYHLHPDSQSFTVAPIDVTFTYNQSSIDDLLATPQSYSVTGGSASLNKTYKLSCINKVYLTNMVSADLDRSYRLNAQTRNFVAADPGTVIALFEVERYLSVTTQVYLGYWGLRFADLFKTSNFPANTQTYSVSGVNASFSKNYLFGIDTQTYSASGVNANLGKSVDIEADTQTFSITGVDNALTYNVPTDRRIFIVS